MASEVLTAVGDDLSKVLKSNPTLLGLPTGGAARTVGEDTRRWPTLAPALDLSKRGGLRVEFPSERIYVVDQVAHEWLSCMLQPETRYGRRDSASSTQ